MKDWTTDSRIHWLSSWLLLVLAFLLYIWTLDNGFFPEELRGGDLITHQYAQVQARPSNAPGYPLYTMGGWLWFHGWRGLLETMGNPLLDSVANPIRILSSYSLFWALLSLYFFYQIVSLLLIHLGSTKNPLPEANRLHHYSALDSSFAWLLSAFYAVTYFFWYYATTTEQYTSAIAHTLAIVYVYLRLSYHSSSGNSQVRVPQEISKGDSKYIVGCVFLLAFLSGLALAHMLTVAFIVPPLVLLLLWDYPWLVTRVRIVLGAILMAALPLSSYLYVYIRGGLHPEWRGEGNWTSTNDWFWSFVSTAQGRDELARGFEAWCGVWAGNFPAGIWQELSLPILVLGMVGLALMGWRLALFFYSTLIIYLIFCWMYRCGNWFQVILPAYPLILLGLVPLYSRFQRWQAGRSLSANSNLNQSQLYSDPVLKRRLVSSHKATETSSFESDRIKALLKWLPHLLLLAALIWRIDASWPQANSRDRIEDTALDRAAQLLADELPSESALFASVDDALALQYLNQIWDIRPDLTIIDHKEARRRLGNGQPVLTPYDATPLLLGEIGDDPVPGIWAVSANWVLLQPLADADFQLSSAHLTPKSEQGSPSVLLNQSIETGVELVGYHIAREPSSQYVVGRRHPIVDVTLYWQLALVTWPEGLSISVRPSLQGAFLPLSTIEKDAPPDAIIQQDQRSPMQGLYPLSQIPAGSIFSDVYRLPIASRESADEIVLLLYRQNSDGFINVADIRMTVP
ncbi:MAG: hypothetical protein AAF702_12715 [Chloroflexota bacterium]